MGPLQALQAQHRLASWWKTDAAQRFATGMSASMAKKRAPMQIDPVMVAKVQCKNLPTMPTYSVTPDMVTLVEAAAESYPGQAMYVEDLPSPSGFCMFDRGIMLLDVSETPAEILAFSWELVDNAEGILLLLYSGLDDIVNYEWQRYGADTDIDKLRRKFGAGLALLHIAPVVFGQEYKTDLSVAHNHLAFIEALFAVMQQELVVTARWQPPRGFRRELERKDLASDVRVVTLRRVRYRDKHGEGEGRFVEWTHQWLVTGHWRRIWNEKRAQLRLIWVRPHVKGPPDKPLIVKPVVHRLSR